MTHPHASPSASPRWPVLSALVALVLGAHLVMLAGGVTLNLPDTLSESTRQAPQALVDAGPPAAAHTSERSTQGAVAVRVSSVRWITPTPDPQPQTVAPNATAAKPAPRVTAARLPLAAPSKPAAVTALPAPAEQTEAPVAESPPEPAEAQPEAASMVQVDPPAPTEQQPEPPAVDTAANGDTEDTLLAAATPSKPRSAATAAPLPPARLPASTRLLYDVVGQIKGIAYRAEGALTWTQGDGRYEARMEMRVPLLGSRSQTSAGRVGASGLMPERFADKSRSEKATHFEAATQRIVFSNNAPQAPLQPGAQDRLSLFLQLAGLLQARPQVYVAGQTLDMQVAGTGDAPIWRFEVGAESTLAVPAGEFKVRRLVRQPRKEFDSTVEMWLAPSLGHLPVRLRVTQANGDVADQQLRQMP